jgi:hypothetical protein
MKTKTLLLLLALSSTIALGSCNRDKRDKEMSDADIAATVENSLASDGGSALHAEQLARMSTNFAVPAFCSLNGDSTFSVTGSQGRYTLFSVWTWAVNCTGNIPTSISFTLSGSSNYDGTNLDLEAILGGNATLSGFGSGGNYILDGLLTRVGNGSLVTERRSKAFSSELYLDFDALNISKTTNEILSGTASLTLNGAVVDGVSYARTGSIVFNGGGSATLTLDNGAVFTLQL